MRATSTLSGKLIALQVAGAALCLCAMAFYPPRHGKMILVPVLPGAGNALAAQAVRNGALLIDKGPLPGSLVVSGDRDAILPAMLRAGVITFASPPAGCSDGTGATA